ncbi:hypothetical protein [uncultured Microbulbifer sp.]|uniref:hypothetical protein n=1 Tax=uncultured Microbulbifer sp. TaxID=348147 RepID=UPI0026363357|nr:hypothetical protein [uncultured Microbulbifer sp.]
MIRKIQSVTKCFLVAICFLSLTINAEKVDLKSSDVFERMKLLQGDWKKEGDTAGNFHIKFSQTAADSVLVENWLYKRKSHSLTIYHIDNSNLLATHYCPQGNQPRLQLTSSVESRPIEFSFKDAGV